MPKRFRWTRLHSKLAAVLGLSITVILLNIAAYKHAHAMLNFAQVGERTEPPESLSLWQKIKILLRGIHIPKPLNHSMPDSWGLPFETHRFKVNHKIELEAWHIPHPQAKGLVLLFHGYASCKSKLLPEASILHELGYTTFLVDFRGSGDSSDSETSIGFYEADDKEYLHHLSMAQASLAELETQFEITARLKYLSSQQLSQALEQAASLGRQLYALRNALTKGIKSQK